MKPLTEAQIADRRKRLIARLERDGYRETLINDVWAQPSLYGRAVSLEYDPNLQVWEAVLHGTKKGVRKTV